MAFPAGADLCLGLREVDVEAYAPLAAERGEPAQAPLAGGVHGVGGQVERHKRATIGQVLEELAAGAALGDAPGFVHAVDQRIIDDEAHARVGGGPGLGTGVKVHVVAERGASLDHLKAGEAGTPIDILFGELGLAGPDGSAEPLVQLEVLGGPAQEGHGRMRVGVDE